MKKDSAVTPFRTPVFDLLRVFLTTLVVNLHIRIVVNGPTNFLEKYTYIAVPLFVVLSFYLTGKYFTQNRLRFTVVLPRLLKFIGVLVLWSVIGFLVQPHLFSVKNAVVQIISGGVVNVPLYYLDLLILFSIFMWAFTYFSMRLRLAMYVIVIGLCFFLEYSGWNFHTFSQLEPSLKYCYGRFFEVIKYAPLGIYFKLIVDKLEKPQRWLFGVLVLSIVLFYLSLSLPRIQDFHYGGVPLFFSVSAIFAGVLLLSKLHFPVVQNRVVTWFGKYSFAVYLLHFVLLQFLVLTISPIKTFIVSHSLLFLVIYMALCYGLCFVYERIAKKVVYSLT